MGKIRGPNSNLVTNGFEAQKKISTVARTKLGVYKMLVEARNLIANMVVNSQ